MNLRKILDNKTVVSRLRTGFEEGSKPSWLTETINDTSGGANPPSISYEDANNRGNGYALLETGASSGNYLNLAFLWNLQEYDAHHFKYSFRSVGGTPEEIIKITNEGLDDSLFYLWHSKMTGGGIDALSIRNDGVSVKRDLIEIARDDFYDVHMLFVRDPPLVAVWFNEMLAYRVIDASAIPDDDFVNAWKFRFNTEATTDTNCQMYLYNIEIEALRTKFTMNQRE